jgi:iron complex transport system ATP-binding protein
MTLEARSISVRYDTQEVVRDVSFCLETGKVVAIVGPNGAGKTSLIRALNGAIELSGGEMLLSGKLLKSYSRREIAKQIAVVAQENETKFPVSVLEFVLGGRFAHGGVFGWESENDITIAKSSLALCDLAGYEGRLLNHLSGGERQRVVFARALATGAQILLLDEPTANIDLSHQALMFRLLRERCNTCESAAVVITHDLNLAAEFADEVLLLNRGGIFAKGAPQEVFTAKNLKEVFEVDVMLDRHPLSGRPRLTMNYSG